MSGPSILDQEKFWEIVGYLMNLDQSKSFDSICQELQISKHQLNCFVQFLREVNCDLECLSEEGAKKLKGPVEQPKISVEFTLLEWLQFQANFPVLGQNQQKPYFDLIAKKLGRIEQKYRAYDLFTPAHNLELISGAEEQHDDQVNFHLEFLEDCILEERAVRVSCQQKKYPLYPRLVVFIEGSMALIAESINDHCLVKLDLKDIELVQHYEHLWEPKFSKFEIDEFVLGLRAIDENEIRLILKIYSIENFHLELKNQLISNPCMVTNPHGELIWAASVEPSEVIFEWILSLGESVEIIDPMSFKQSYLMYCESKLKKLA